MIKRKTHSLSSILYVTYDGLMEPLGQSQILRYMERLVLNFRIVIISFEKQQDWQEVVQRRAMYKYIHNLGIIWIPLRYHKKPSIFATAFDILIGFWVSIIAIYRYDIRVIHARSYVPSVIALYLKKIFNKKFIFDMRGFWADERVEGDLWPRDSILYQVAKWFERQFLLNADIVVSLTHAAVQEMKQWDFLQSRKVVFEVITTCTDLRLFQMKQEESTFSTYKGYSQPLTLGYVGSVGVWYLFDEVLECFKFFKSIRPNTRLHILNRGTHPFIWERIRFHNIPIHDIKVESLDANGVVKAMQKMDIGIFFIKPVYSKIASAPTKLGEFLGCGIPCLTNAGIGDLEGFIKDENIGVVLKNLDSESIRKGVLQILSLISDEMIKKRCVEASRKHFSLDIGVAAYTAIYEKLLKA